MRATRKIIGVLLALMLVFGMSSSVFAANDCSITITNAQKNHTYKIYQIFTGKVYEEGGKAGLTNIAWGSSVTAEGKTALGDAGAKAKTLNTAAKASDFAEELADNNYLGNPLETKTAEANGALAFTGLAPGYYMIADPDSAVAETYKGYLLKVTTDGATVMVKNGVPEVEKKVKDTNDFTDITTDWQDSADWDINDDVPFKLTATLANNVEAYTEYKVVFHDTLSAGLTYNYDAVVKVDGKTVEGVGVTYNGTALTFTMNNAKAFGAKNNSIVTVEYSAKLNDNAVIGSAGNPNTVYLEYSNNPYVDTTKNTVTDKVIVFTYKTVVNKVDENGAALPGAEFKLEKVNADNSTTLIGVVKNDAGTTFTFTGLDDGKYILTETKAPDGYNDIAPIEFTISATHSDISDDPKLITLSGGDRFTGNVESCTLEGAVVNETGSLLPSTGGMGTTILYIVGGLLIVGAAGALVYRRRTAA
ncbi:MAG: isopeptide-forming domain-containing fimbrial protein [Firmicutes bacterium]|nr:isopeptide-forming domain-containing fimbrial protein [Bacillota bacterium]